jgi:hypothetical protein
LNWKYRNKDVDWTKIHNSDNLIFAVNNIQNDSNIDNLYINMITEFERSLAIIGMDERKEGMKRRKITLHSLRRCVKTTISDQTNQDYSEWFLGHHKSPYYTKKESERREIYATKCMKYLTYLDYTTLEATGKSIELKLSEKDKQIEELVRKQERFEQLIQSLIDSGQLKPSSTH